MFDSRIFSGRSLANTLLATALVLPMGVQVLTATSHAAAAKPLLENVGEPVSLNARVAVTSDRILLGDVFQGAGQYANRAIARAPAPGKTLTLEPRWLMKVARAYRLDWRPTSKFDVSQVTRNSRMVDGEMVTDAILEAVQGEAAPSERFEVEINNRMLALHVPAGRELTVGVQPVPD